MPLPQLLLVPTDFGEPSEVALDHAIGLARALQTGVVLMHAYEIPIVGFPDGAIVATAELTSRILEGAQVGLDRQIQRREGSGVVIKGVIKQGEATQMINETASEIGAGMIVMGTHGRRGLPRALIGSVAEKVVRTAHVPVLTVHAGDEKLTIPRPEREPPNGVVTPREPPNGVVTPREPAVPHSR